jgi:hypothetical protein
MSFIKESYIAYKKVQEAEDHEISMARGELEAIADKATQLASMLQGKSEEGNPLQAWVQSKITKAKDYINSVSDYMMYNPDMKQNEELQLEESTFEKIYQMQQDGKSLDDIAKELKLKPELVKKVLGESKEISEGLSDAQIAQLKKEYEPLKGKTITGAKAKQLMNILDKFKDDDLIKLSTQNIPFISSGSKSKLVVRNMKFKVTKVTVPGLEGMAEENQYVAVHVKKGKTSVTANSSYEAAKKASEKFGLNDTTGITVMLAKKDGEDVIHKATEQKEESDKKLPKDLEDLNKKSKEIEKKFRDSLKIPTKNEEVEESFKDNIIKKLVKPIKDYNKKKEEPKKEEVKESHFSMGQHVIFKGPKNPITPIKAQIIKLEPPYTGAYYQIKKADGETTYASPDQLELDESFTFKQSQSNDAVHKVFYKGKEIGNIFHIHLFGTKPGEKHWAADVLGKAKKMGHVSKMDAAKELLKLKSEELEEACWVGYKQVGLKKKGKRMVPNCVKEDKRLYIESIVAVKNKAEKSGMPYPVLKQVYDRGMAAWKGGHRPGATQVQWALARVNSFITKSSGTWGGADSDLAKKVKG